MVTVCVCNPVGVRGCFIVYYTLRNQTNACPGPRATTKKTARALAAGYSWRRGHCGQWLLMGGVLCGKKQVKAWLCPDTTSGHPPGASFMISMSERYTGTCFQWDLESMHLLRVICYCDVRRVYTRSAWASQISVTSWCIHYQVKTGVAKRLAPYGQMILG